MTKPIVRMLMALLLGLGVGVFVCSSIWVASAQPGSRIPQQLFGTTTVARTSVTTVASSAATTPSIVTPTTRPVTATRPRAVVPTTTSVPPPTTAAPTTTVAAIPGAAPPPVTLPLALATQSGHVSVLFPILSGLGFAALVAMLVAQYFLTAPGSRGPTL